MSTITRERLEWLSNISGRDDIDEIDGEEIRELARIALASREAEAVADVVAWSSPNEERTCDVHLRRHDIKPGPLYAAPPAQAVPEVYNIGDATMRHIFTPAGITDVSDMQAVFDQIETVLAGMWQPAPVSLTEEQRAMLRDMDDEIVAELEEEERICRAAMLQGAGVTKKCRSSEKTQVLQDYPEALPCPVLLEPGLRFGKGVPTKTMLGALQRRAEYNAELDDMTPEQLAEHEAGMKEFATMLQGGKS